MKFAVVVFPGSNCDNDALYATSRNLGEQAVFLWHKEHSLPSDVDCVILPGGFSYGDYLRSGAIARFSPIMKEVVAFAERGGFVLGICNGFQVLTESGLLPGALARNERQLFSCKDVYLRVEQTETAFTNAYRHHQVLRMPIAHGEGSYFANAETLAELEANNQIVFRYCSPSGVVENSANPNGSLHNIAGIRSKRGNVLGLMPHPERVCDAVLGGTDGLGIFQSVLQTVNSQVLTT